MNIDPPQGCHPFIYDNGTSSPLVLRGKMYNVGATQYIGDLVQPSAYEGAVQQKSSACQRLLFAVAARVAHRRLQDTTILRCAPYAQAIYTTVNLTLPDLDLDTSASPHMPNANGPIQETTNVTRTPDLAYQCKGMDAQAQYANASLDPFVAAATLGQDGVPAADLVGPANADRLIARLEKVYAQMLSQAYHFAYRESVASPGIGASFAFDILAPPFNGTITANKERLVQSAVATKIIESILAVMAACAVLHCALTWGEERVVPRDPGSVAAKMSFWAGSEVVKRIAAAIEFGEKDWKECFEGEVLGLRWWEREGEDGTGGRGFGIDVGMPAAGEEE
ncbi:hypothetical protein B0J12DRAFT_694038 [Macrophomina phaseolina]|uniref:Uncharacterized protein n=1 Tax=Macrophomina phaseolina TaxID=35725 RepID=A0ABQ8GUK2_9PEZI|nr:hypothetical protein B0J12DRAFT_694038 [Macrophomina phaseolina]